MTRLFLLLSLLLLCSCAPSVPAQYKPLASATARQDGQGVVQVAQNSPIALISPTAAKQAIPTVDYAAAIEAQQQTITAYERKQIDVTERARADTMLIASYTGTAQANANAFAFASQTALKPASTKTKAAEETETSQRSADGTRVSTLATQAAQKPTQIVLVARADAEKSWGWLDYLARAILLAAIAALLLAMARAVATRKPQVVQDEPEEKRDYPGTAFHPSDPHPSYTPLVRRITPPGVSVETMIRFANGVKTSRNPGGTPLSRAEWVGAGLVSRKSWESIIAYCTDPERAYAYKIGDAESSPLAFSPEGVRYLSSFLDPLPHTDENSESV